MRRQLHDRRRHSRSGSRSDWQIGNPSKRTTVSRSGRKQLMATLVDRKSAKRGSDSPASMLAGRRVDDRSLRTRPKRTGLLVAAALMIVVFGLGFALLLSQAGEK